ncbi:hypothetical protein EDC14_1008128 [Hydrogenispora ethanolica]|uniref:Tetratricopeptide repeat protein n=1 Tax=Hydrogenispora ethanolica TaxID=1082276 RepID=A0A4R1RWB7_HYDET|nr:hypothetical protein [Hydrogenispora ethanolica]TCL70978.1 hypothetical protein EDC14_1008128 [Hydrogenispora ethanolica]
MPICPNCTQSHPAAVHRCPECRLDLITDQTMLSEAKLYQAAFALQNQNQFQAALNLYHWLIELYPGTPEADHAATQVQTIESTPIDQRPGPEKNAEKPEALPLPGPNRENSLANVRKPMLTVFFNIVGIFFLSGGAVYAKLLWPDIYVTGGLSTVAYIPSVTCLISGIILAIVFYALGKIIDDLAFIRHQIRQLRQ